MYTNQQIFQGVVFYFRTDGYSGLNLKSVKTEKEGRCLLSIHIDVGFPSVCSKYHWLIKKQSCANAVNSGRLGKLNLILGDRRKSERNAVEQPLETFALKRCWLATTSW